MKWSTFGSKVVSSLKANGVYDDGIHQIVILTITTQGMKKTSACTTQNVPLRQLCDIVRHCTTTIYHAIVTSRKDKTDASHEAGAAVVSTFKVAHDCFNLYGLKTEQEQSSSSEVGDSSKALSIVWTRMASEVGLHVMKLGGSDIAAKIVISEVLAGCHRQCYTPSEALYHVAVRSVVRVMRDGRMGGIQTAEIVMMALLKALTDCINAHHPSLHHWQPTPIMSLEREGASSPSERLAPLRKVKSSSTASSSSRASTAAPLAISSPHHQDWSFLESTAARYIKDYKVSFSNAVALASSTLQNLFDTNQPKSLQDTKKMLVLVAARLFLEAHPTRHDN
jgi:hypothetical protein